jgi:hypothetical protein
METCVKIVFKNEYVVGLLAAILFAANNYDRRGCEKIRILAILLIFFSNLKDAKKISKSGMNLYFFKASERVSKF